MTAHSYAQLAGAIFALVALLQVIRAALGWSATIGSFVVPVWASWVAAVVAAVLAWLGFSAS